MGGGTAADMLPNMLFDGSDGAALMIGLIFFSKVDEKIGLLKRDYSFDLGSETYDSR
jgi:hypothetical protein